MSFYLLSYQSACVSSIWCLACWLFSYYLSTQLYHKMAFHVAVIAEPTLNVLDNGDAMPCPFPWLSGVNPHPLPSSLSGWYTVPFSACHEAFALDGQAIVSLVVL